MRLHLQNRATHWNDDGSLAFEWCVMTCNGRKVTPWLTYKAAESRREKLIFYREKTS